MKNKTLVSVVVVTYNSADYVIETLESIKAQTYEDIELIVSDDASTDDTIILVKQWLDGNKNRFVKYRVVESETNTGITPNINRGVVATTGEYIKPIAGDDLLYSDCIEKLLEYVLKENLNFAYSKVSSFSDSHNDYEAKIIKYEKLGYEIFEQDVKQQHRTLLTGFPMSTIGLFLKREFIISIGGFDEKYKMMEDYPFAVKVTSLGYKLNLLHEYVVKYRVRPPSARVEFFSTKRKSLHAINLSNFQVEELLPMLKKEKMYIAIYNMFINRLAANIENYNSGLVFSYLSKIVGYLAFSKILLKIKMLRLR